MLGVVQFLNIFDQQCTGAVGQEKSFMGVNGDGVGFLNTIHFILTLFGKQKETAVSRINMEPDVLSFGNPGDLLQGIYGTEIGCTCRGKNDERLLALLFILLYLFIQ